MLSNPNRKRRFGMKFIITTIVISSVMLIGGCNKTEKVRTSTTTVQPDEMDVNVEIEDGEIIMMINGEERVIDFSEIMDSIDLEGVDGEVSIAVMALASDENDEPKHEMYMMRGEHGGPHKGMEEMHERMMQMRGGSMGEHGGPHKGMEEMHERMMQMRGPRNNRDGNPHHNMCGKWCDPHEDRDVPEEHQFMEELAMFEEMSNRMSPESMTMLGIHMIRDRLENEVRLAALNTIIDESEFGLPSRNAAIIVAIETLQDLDRDEEAAQLMVDLVLSN
jgi:hypothetical protein